MHAADRVRTLRPFPAPFERSNVPQLCGGFWCIWPGQAASLWRLAAGGPSVQYYDGPSVQFCYDGPIRPRLPPPPTPPSPAPPEWSECPACSPSSRSLGSASVVHATTLVRTPLIDAFQPSTRPASASTVHPSQVERLRPSSAPAQNVRMSPTNHKPLPDPMEPSTAGRATQPSAALSAPTQQFSGRRATSSARQALGIQLALRARQGAATTTAAASSAAISEASGAVGAQAGSGCAAHFGRSSVLASTARRE